MTSTNATIVIVSGGFDPIHSGHIKYLSTASTLGNILYVGVNSNNWLIRKKGNFFMDFDERVKIVQSIKGVDYAIGFDDADDSAADLIRKIREKHPASILMFANGGDRIGGTRQSQLEMQAADSLTFFVVGVGGFDKTNSSSKLLERWKGVRS